MGAAVRRLEYQPLDAVQRAVRNPNPHRDADVEASVRRHGFVHPMVLDERTGRLLDGHGRLDVLLAMRQAGEPPPDGISDDWQVPVNLGWASVDDAEAEALQVAMIQLPKTPIDAAHAPTLAAMLDDIASNTTAGLDGTGFNADSLDDLLATLRPPPRDRWNDRPVRGLPDPGSFQAGQVWQIGPHRLVVGDARLPDCWRVLPAAQLLITDPPYGIGYDGGADAARIPLDGDSDPDEAAALLDAVLGHHVDLTPSGCMSYIFLPGGPSLPPLLAVVVRRGLFRWHLVWVKDVATIGRSDFNPRHENIIYGWLPGPRRLHPNEDHTATTVFDFPKPRASEHHPTAKPVPLLQRLIELSSGEGDVVCDPFAGSGSTLVAAARCGRVGVGIEISASYGRVAVDRLAEATGETPVLVGGGE